MKTNMTIEELQAEHRRILAENREKVKERKARTRRLIQFGAIASTFVDGANGMTPEEFKETMRKRFQG